ncbi:MAG: pyruvate ferredoxin oxidoreductase, partial [Nanoarchaeota archaeon]|nr:pyruvate ferredoxin oxidoreductase [Nanoarchaeota archaeon]
GTARFVVDSMRKQGKKVGLIKIKSFRPFPTDNLIKAAANLKSIAVIDKEISLGNEGALFTEVRSALYGRKPKILGFIAGLGGKDIRPDHLEKALDNAISMKEVKEEWLL